MRSAALQERLESRRGWEAGEAAAASQHAALLAAAARSWRLQFDSDWPGRELAAALAAIGPPDSAPMLAALGYGDQGALRFVCEPERRLEAVALLVVAYGESPDACAGMLRLLEDDVHAIFRAACRGSGGAPAAGALLGAYRRAGRLHEALAADDHAALRGAASIGADSASCRPCWRSTASPGARRCWRRSARGRTRRCAPLAPAAASRRRRRCWRPTGTPAAPQCAPRWRRRTQTAAASCAGPPRPASSP